MPRRIDVYPRTTKPTNFLFRGNMPVINGSFAFKEIVASMAKVAQAKNLTFPTNFTLIDVRLILVIHCMHSLVPSLSQSPSFSLKAGRSREGLRTRLVYIGTVVHENFIVKKFSFCAIDRT